MTLYHIIAVGLIAIVLALALLFEVRLRELEARHEKEILQMEMLIEEMRDKHLEDINLLYDFLSKIVKIQTSNKDWIKDLQDRIEVIFDVLQAVQDFMSEFDENFIGEEKNVSEKKRELLNFLKEKKKDIGSG